MEFFGTVFSDASGEGYGIGVLIENIIAFQCKRELYEPFLTHVFHKEKDPLHIQYQELLAFLMAIW